MSNTHQLFAKKSDEIDFFPKNRSSFIAHAFQASLCVSFENVIQSFDRKKVFSNHNPLIKYSERTNVMTFRH